MHFQWWHAISCSVCDACLYFNTKANIHMTFGLLSLSILIRRCQICSLEWTHLLGRNIHLSFRIKAESWRLILTYFNLHTHRYSRADLESVLHSFFRALTELIPKVQSLRWEMHERSFVTAVPPTVCWSLQKSKTASRGTSRQRLAEGERDDEGTYLEFWKPFFNNTSLWTQHLHQRPPTRLPKGQEREWKGQKGVREEATWEGRGEVLSQKCQNYNHEKKKRQKFYIFIKYSKAFG